MGFLRFLLAVFSGRMVRFLVLALLTLKFGPDVVRLFGAFFREHYYVVITLAVAALVAWLMHRRAAKTN